MNTDLTPVTILTGFLGSGKTTLLNHILREAHGHRIVVIENEFGEAGVDNELLFQEQNEQIIVMNNGCICCTVRGDLIRMLGELSERKTAGEISFDRVLIETTGLADPAPVAQTFFVDEPIKAAFRLDGIVTMVDAKHAQMQLDEHHEAQEQVGFADRLLISKSDLVAKVELDALRARLHDINPRAPQRVVENGRANVADVLDLNGFDISAILEIEPGFFEDLSHEHDDDIKSFAWRTRKPFDRLLLEQFMAALMRDYGKDLLRYKGIVAFKYDRKRIVFQGVHMMMTAVTDRNWRPSEPRESVLVFIGRNLPTERMAAGLKRCLAKSISFDRLGETATPA